jgi:hypothetical protein
MRDRTGILRLVELFLVLQGVGVIVWWGTLLHFPAARQPFLAPGAPETTLFAFLLPDLSVYAASSLVAAYGLWKGAAWAWPALCVNAGAGVYTALYALSLPLWSGGEWLGAAMMAPALIVLPVAVWVLRPEGVL